MKKSNKNTETSFLPDETSRHFKPFAHFSFTCAAYNNIWKIFAFQQNTQLSVFPSFGTQNLLYWYYKFSVYLLKSLLFKLRGHLVQSLINKIGVAIE